MTFFVEAGATIAIEAGRKGVPLVQPLLRKLRYRLTRGHTRIVIFGAGGSGKTTLVRFLAGKPRTGQDATRYETTLTREQSALRAALPSRVSLALPRAEQPHGSSRPPLGADHCRL